MAQRVADGLERHHQRPSGIDQQRGMIRTDRFGLSKFFGDFINLIDPFGPIKPGQVIGESRGSIFINNTQRLYGPTLMTGT
jgi:hypothetical protein